MTTACNEIIELKCAPRIRELMQIKPLPIDRCFEIGSLLIEELNEPGDTLPLDGEPHLGIRSGYAKRGFERALKALGKELNGQRSRLQHMRRLASCWTFDEAAAAAARGMSLRTAVSLLTLDTVARLLEKKQMSRDAGNLRKIRRVLARQVPTKASDRQAWDKWKGNLARIHKNYAGKAQAGGPLRDLSNTADFVSSRIKAVVTRVESISLEPNEEWHAAVAAFQEAGARIRVMLIEAIEPLQLAEVPGPCYP